MRFRSRILGSVLEEAACSRNRVIEYAERISRILSEVLKDSGSSIGSDWTCSAMVGTGLLSAVSQSLLLGIGCGDIDRGSGTPIPYSFPCAEHSVVCCLWSVSVYRGNVET